MAAVNGRYARAYAEVIAVKAENPDKATEELDEMAALVNGSADLRNVFENPAVAHDQKIKLLDAIIERMAGIKPPRRVFLLRNFVAVLIDHKRIGLIGEIAALFKREMEQRMGITEALISSFRELTAAEKKSLEKQLTAVTGKTVRASYSEDSSLLGGAVVRIGSTVYDGSVRGQLQRLKEEIAGS